MQLITVVDKYFVETINDQDFVIGLDPTGVFVFTESTNIREVNNDFRELKEDLDLNDKESILCFIGKPLGVYQNEVTLDELGDWIREVTISRPTIFNRADLQDIEDCYKTAADDELSLVDVLREYNLPDGIIYHLIDKKPQNIREVKELGVVDEIAVDVFKILQDGIYEQKSQEGGRVPSGITVTLSSYLKRQAIKCLVFEMLACVILAITKYFLAAFIVSVTGFCMMRKAICKSNQLTVKYVVFLSSILMFVTAFVGCIKVMLYFMQS